MSREADLTKLIALAEQAPIFRLPARLGPGPLETWQRVETLFAIPIGLVCVWSYGVWAGVAGVFVAWMLAFGYSRFPTRDDGWQLDFARRTVAGYGKFMGKAHSIGSKNFLRLSADGGIHLYVPSSDQGHTLELFAVPFEPTAPISELTSKLAATISGRFSIQFKSPIAPITYE